MRIASVIYAPTRLSTHAHAACHRSSSLSLQHISSSARHCPSSTSFPLQLHGKAMQKSQLDVDQWHAPLIRTRSGNSRDNRKVSCETLSKVDWYSRRPYEAQLYYHSDDDEEENPASEAEEDEEYGGDREERGDTGRLESLAYGDELSTQGHYFLACFHSTAAKGTSAAAISSPARDAKKTGRAPRTYPSPIPHSGSLLPYSGRLLPHSGPIKLHVGSHTNTHASSKLSGSIRGSSLIPSNITGKSSKSSGFGNANEPSSPKVTCLGRVKIKQKYCREMGRLADMGANVASNGKVHWSIGDQIMKFTRRKNNAHAGEKDPVTTEERQKPPTKVTDMSSREKPRSKDGKRASKACDLSAAGATAEHGNERGPFEENNLRKDANADSESKGRKGKWRLKETSARMKFRGGDKKKWQRSDANLDCQNSASEAHSAIDLNRFRSVNQPHTQHNRLTKSLASFDESLKIEQTDDREYVPEVPPPNSLLLMRNSKSREACATIATSSICRRHGTDNYEEAVAVDKGEHMSLLTEDSSKEVPSLPLGVEMNEGELARMANGFEQTTSFAETKVKKLCVVVPTECSPFQVKTNAFAHRQISLPKTPKEVASLWQRRCIMKPSSLSVGKPLTLQVKQPSTR